MVVSFIVAGLIGWLLGVWLPWWAICCVLAYFAIAGFRGAFNGGLEVILIILTAIVFCAAMVFSGFATGDVTLMQLFGFVKVAFTGS